MGLGDWIMATSLVREINKRTGKKVVVVDRLNRPRWSEAFENNPRILRQHEFGAERLLNAGGARPYIKAKTDRTWFWKRWDISPGELFLSEEETGFAQRYKGVIILEPNTKVLGGNKAWPFDRWQEVARQCSGLELVQIGAPDARKLTGVRFIPTSVREAFAILSVSRLFVGTEGALHHAAAALSTPAVVLWSEFISPAFTGYSNQYNIRKTNEVCGARYPCKSCSASMEAITVDEVVEVIRSKVT